ncbi:hypothetical protein [Nocardia sp. NPDC046763]|uniref:hypothetical protein n=1 Tax=Nocardia sp. NPDC046763 TaxID=3155256 RepID=UPI0033FD5F4A
MAASTAPVGGAAMIGPVVRTDAAVLRGLGDGLSLLPVAVRLALLAVGLLFAMVGCTAAWIDQQSYTPSPNICRADEVGHRADCVAPQQLAHAPQLGVVR